MTVEKAVRLLRAAPDYAAIGLAFLIVIDLLWADATGRERQFSDGATIGIFAAAFGALALSTMLRNGKIDRAAESLAAAGDRVEVLPNGHNNNPTDRYRNAESIRVLTISGTKNAHLGSKEALANLFHNARRKDVRILLANPYSSALLNRYANDEPNSAEVGVEGLKRRIRFLWSELRDLDARDREHIQVRIYDSYPTVNFIRIDSEYVSGVFGYKLRGLDCPRVRSTVGSLHAKFLEQQFSNIFEVAMAIDEWMKQHSQDE